MAISNLASGLRTGVCTSTTRPTAPYNGQVIYETDSKQTLVWQGSAWVMLTDADTPPGLVLIKTQTVGSAVSSVEVTSAFSADFDNYEITYNGGTMSTTDAQLGVALGSTTTNYRTTLLYNINSSTASAATTTAYGYFSWAGGGNTSDAYAHFKLFSPYLSRHTRYESPAYLAWDNAGFGHAWGVQTSTTSFTAFTLQATLGTMTGGTIRVYGYRNTV